MVKLIFGTLIVAATALGSLYLVNKTRFKARCKTSKIGRRDGPKTRSMKSHNTNNDDDSTIATKNCVLCELPCNDKCKNPMCEKIKRAIWIFSKCSYEKAHRYSMNSGFACNCDGEWSTSDFFYDILKNDTENIRGKITQYLEENPETRINEISVKRILRKDWPTHEN